MPNVLSATGLTKAPPVVLAVIAGSRSAAEVKRGNGGGSWVRVLRLTRDFWALNFSSNQM